MTGRAFAVLMLLVVAACGDRPGTEPSTSAPSSADPSASARGRPPSQPAATSSPSLVPEDFPITVGMAPDGGDFDRRPPTTDGDGIGPIEICGRSVWPSPSVPTVGRLVTRVSGPEYLDARELLVHDGADRAIDVHAAIVRAVESCTRFRDQVWTRIHHETGFVSVTVGLTHRRHLGSSVFQFTRVGSAVLLVHRYGEGTVDSLAPLGRQATTVTRRVAPAMCAFTEAGCQPVEPPTLGPDGVPPVRLGMPVTAVEDVGGTLEDAHGQGCTTFGLRLGSGELVLGTIAPRGGVSVLTVEHGRTPEGAGPGTTVPELRRLYRNELTRAGVDWLAAVPHADRRYRFTVRDGTVRSVALERASGKRC